MVHSHFLIGHHFQLSQRTMEMKKVYAVKNYKERKYEQQYENLNKSSIQLNEAMN